MDTGETGGKGGEKFPQAESLEDGRRTRSQAKLRDDGEQ